MPLTINSHAQLALALFKLPGVQPATGWEAQIDAGMIDQLQRRPWRRALRKVRRSPHNLNAHVRPDAHRYHVLRDLLTGPYAGIDDRARILGVEVLLEFG